MSQPASEDNYLTEIEGFIDALFGDQTGYIYTPTKHNTGEVDSKGNPVFFWQPYFWKYPSKKHDAATHMLTHADGYDCYIAPSMFKAPNPDKKAWKGSNYVWIEFDGNAPKDLPDGVPSPSMRVQSSTKGHEHWYWRLSDLCSDRAVLEGLSRQLTYTLDADKSGWDCTQVLRPPGTVHHDSRKRVRLLSAKEGSVTFGDFRNLVTVPESAVVNTTFDDLPDVQDVIARHKWTKDALDLFKKPRIEVGKRSSAMTRLGFECIEMGMTNEECYAILLNADERWGKFKSRVPAERAKRLIGIITHCRSKKEILSELRLTDRESFVSLGDFELLDIKVNWLFQDFLTERGLGTISAQPGVGKSTLSLRLGMDAILGNKFLKWNYAGTKQSRVGFISLEMAGLELNKMIIQDMKPGFSEENWDKLRSNLYLLPLGFSLALGNKEAQQFVLDEIDKHDLNVLIIDSLKGATGLDEKVMDKFYEWINKYVRNDRGCTVWIVHHNRKPSNEGSRKPRGLEDLYGDQYISAYATTVVSLWRRTKSDIEVLPFKIRLAEEADPFVIRRKPHLGFAVLEGSSVANESTSESERVNDARTKLFG